MSKLNCNICKNKYNEKNNLPLTLPCNHIICKSCLNRQKNKNIYFCKKCNKNILLSKNNIKPNQIILKNLQMQSQDNSNDNQNIYSSKEEEGEEEQDEENEEGEEELNEENDEEEGEEEEDDIDENDEIVEENSENENNTTNNNESHTINNISKIRNNDKKKNSKTQITQNSHIKKSILKNSPKYRKINDNSNDNDKDLVNYNNKNKKKRKGIRQNINNIKRTESPKKKNVSFQDIGPSRVNFSSQEISQDNEINSESNNENTENEESENEEEEEEENNYSKNNDNNKKNSKDIIRKLSRKGTNYSISNKNSFKENKDYKFNKKEESESIRSLEGDDFCIKHKDKKIEFFCYECNSAVCSLCIYETHNGHILKLLDDMSGTIKKKMGDLFSKMQDIIRINKDNKFNWQKRKDEVNEYKNQQINIVIKSFKEIYDILEEKKNLIIKEFKNKYNHEFNRFDQIKMFLDNNGKKMEVINNSIEKKIKSFNINSDAKILKDIEKLNLFYRQVGLEFIKLQKNEISIKADLNLDPATKPMKININGLKELLNKVDAKSICYPKVIGIIKDENDNSSLNQQKNIGKSDYNSRISHLNSLTGMNNFMNMNMNNMNNIFDNNRQDLNQNKISNISNITSNKYYPDNTPQQILKYRNYSGNKNTNSNLNNRLIQNELNNSHFGEYGPPNHNRGKYLRQLEMTPTATFSNVKRSSKFGIFKESQNSIQNNNINSNNNNKYIDETNLNGNYKENRGGTGIFKENGFGSRGSEYSNQNKVNNINYYNVQNYNYTAQRNKSFGSLNDDSILQRKNKLELKERNPSAGLPLKMMEDNSIILPKISPFHQNNRNSTNENNNNKRSKNVINNSDSEKTNEEIEDSVYFFGEADYCLKFYFKKKKWELIPYKSQLSKQIGLLRNSGLCTLPSYRIILSGGCKKGTDEPSNIFLLINSKNINDVKNLQNLPKKKYYHGCIFVNNNIYIIGGYEHVDRINSIPSTLKNVEQFNLSKNQWQNVNKLNEARACFGQCVFNGQIFVFGGLYNGSSLESIEKYDEENNIWSLYHIKLPMKLAKVGIINIDNQNIFVIGGRDENLEPVNYVFKCKFNSNNDKNVWSKAPDMIYPRTTGNTCFLWKMKIFVFGGNSTNDFEKFDLNNNNWETIENFYSVIKSSNAEMILTNYSCVLNHYRVFP